MTVEELQGKIINADCMDILKQLPDNSIDLLVTDPPYKKIQGGCTNLAVRLCGATKKDLKGGKFFLHNDIEFSEWIPTCYRVLKEKTHCYIMTDDRNLSDIINIGKECGFKLLNILTWKKTKHAPNRYYLKNSEFIVMFRKGEAKNINNMGTYQVLEFANVENKIHPAEKPISLIKCLVSNSSNENDIVLDPFCGSGTTAIACHRLKRRFICIEKDPEYWAKSVERLKAEQAQLQLF